MTRSLHIVCILTCQLLIFVFLCQKTNSTKNNVVIYRIVDCHNFSNINGPLKLNITYRHVKGGQDLGDAFVALDRPFGERISAVVEVQKNLGNNQFKKNFLLIKEKNACKALLTFLGSFWKNMAKIAGVKEPNKCPVPPGNYSFQNYKPTLRIGFDLYKGKFRLIFNVQERFKETLACVLADVALV